MIEAICERQRHRGPDSREIHVSEPGQAAIAIQRLQVIDLETGDQPVSSEDGSVAVVLNGRSTTTESYETNYAVVGSAGGLVSSPANRDAHGRPRPGLPARFAQINEASDASRRHIKPDMRFSVLPHPAFRHHSPAAFGHPWAPRLGRGALTIPWGSSLYT